MIRQTKNESSVRRLPCYAACCGPSPTQCAHGSPPYRCYTTSSFARRETAVRTAAAQPRSAHVHRTSGGSSRKIHPRSWECSPACRSSQRSATCTRRRRPSTATRAASRPPRRVCPKVRRLASPGRARASPVACTRCCADARMRPAELTASHRLSRRAPLRAGVDHDRSCSDVSVFGGRGHPRGDHRQRV